MKWKILFVVLFISVSAYFVFGQGNLIPPGIQNILGPFPIVSCSETDNGPNIYLQGVNSVSFNGTNGSVQNLTGSDYCINNDVLAEGLCGSWIDNNFGTTQWRNSAFVLEVDCGASNYTCRNGECIPYYDDFSSAVLNSNLWEIRPDVEGQPLTDEYDVRWENGSYVFHTQQNQIADRRTYLFPIINFTTGDVLEYDFNVASKEGHYSQMILLTGDQYIRIGIMGYNNGVQGYDELGLSHVKVEFQENNLNLIRTAPSGLVLTDNLALTNTNGNYELYIGTFTGHNGRAHIDYDNFLIYNNSIQSQGNNTNSTNQTFPLVAQWKFDEGNGIIANDSSGNGNTGTLENGVAWTNDSVSGYALHFDGSDDRISTIQTPSIFLTQNVLIEAWIKRDSLVNGTITSSNGPFYLAVYDDKVRGGVYTNGWTEISGTTNLQIGVWYKLKMYYDGSFLRVYINDIEENSVSTTGPIPIVGNNIFIGWGLPGQNYYFNGTIDEVEIRGS